MKYPTIDPNVIEFEPNLHSFIDYVNSDLTIYPTATSLGYKDEDYDFLVGDSGGFLMKMDFIFVNTWQFTEVADFFRKTCSSPIKDDGVYTFAKKGTVEYKQFWRRETQRRRLGMTAKCKLYRKDIHLYNACTTDAERSQYLHELRITGDHYHYLNYGRINRTPNADERDALISAGRLKQKLITSFPRFWT